MVKLVVNLVHALHLVDEGVCPLDVASSVQLDKVLLRINVGELTTHLAAVGGALALADGDALVFIVANDDLSCDSVWVEVHLSLVLHLNVIQEVLHLALSKEVGVRAFGGAPFVIATHFTVCQL